MSSRARGRKALGTWLGAAVMLLAVALFQGPAIAHAQSDLQPTANPLTCAPPCIDLACTGPAEACDGELITLIFAVMNCSEGPQDITVEVQGPAGLMESFNYPSVDPGLSISQEVQATHLCNGGGAIPYSFNAVATNECGDQAEDTCSLLVDCGQPPCVTVSCETPAQACPGEDIPVTLFAQNCSDRDANIQLRLMGPAGELGTWLFDNVPPGGSVAAEQFVILECQPGTVAQYTVEALATNECGEAFDVADCHIECGQPPCVAVACETPPQGCPGEEIPITVIAENCSDRPADILVTVNGPGGLLGQEFFPGVPSFGGVAFEQFVILECEPGTVTQYIVKAIATNECGEASDAAECFVECGPPPCVAVACETPSQGCPGEEIPITVHAQNCSDRPADILVTVNGPGGLLGQEFFPGVPSFGNVAFEQFVILECEPGTVTQYTVKAIATNECGEASDAAECFVECGAEPCVDVACEAPPTAMDGEEIEITAVATNCSGGDEDIIVRIFDPQGGLLCEYHFPGVPAGGAVQVVCPAIANCDEPSILIYNVVVEATNSCGITVLTDCFVTVNCEPPVPTLIKLFEADTDENGVRLALEVQSDAGPLSAIVHRGVSEDLKYAFPITSQPIPFIGSALEFVDETVDPGATYWYWIEIRESGRTVTYAGPISVVAPEPGVSVTFVAPAHPNPTSTSAIFRYSIGSDVAGQGEVGVSLAIYDSRGRLVRTLVNGRQSVGEYSAMWDGRSERGGRVSAGVYYYRFRAGAHSENSSLVITR